MSRKTQATVEKAAKILIVDDDPSLLRLLGIRLSAVSYTHLTLPTIYSV